MSRLSSSIPVSLFCRNFIVEYADKLGKTKDDEDVSGTITVPELAHDTEENEYVVRLLVYPMGAFARRPADTLSLT